MKHDPPTVFVIDDDPLIRSGVRSLIGSVGLRVLTFGSARDFLGSPRPDAPACLVLDVRLPDLSGLDLQRELRESDIHIPIIFITGHGDIPMTVEAMKAGAVEFLTKPFRGQNLLDAVQGAIARDRAARQERTEIAELRKGFDTLSSREREVLRMVVSGFLNKQIAAELGISELTVKTHRAHVMEKMHAGSLAELVRITHRLRSVPEGSSRLLPKEDTNRI
jgi:FixJ family two-component response regulator